MSLFKRFKKSKSSKAPSANATEVPHEQIRLVPLTESMPGGLTHVPSTTASTIRRRRLQKRSSQVPPDARSITSHPDDSDSDMEVLTMNNLGMVQGPPQSTPYLERSRTIQSHRASSPHPGGSRVQQHDDPTVTELVYERTPRPSGGLTYRRDSRDDLETPIIPPPGFTQHHGSGRRASSRPRSHSSRRSGGSTRRTSREQGHYDEYATDDTEHPYLQRIDTHQSRSTHHRGRTRTRSHSRHSQASTSRSHRAPRRRHRSIRPERQSTIIIDMPNGERFEAFADIRYATGTFTYYVVPSGIKTTFKDQHGREITTVGEKGGPITPLVVKDDEGHVIHEVRDPSSHDYPGDGPFWRGPHIVVIDQAGRQLPVYKRRIPRTTEG